MSLAKRCVDRRTQRTRQMVQQAFKELVREKGFSATSIREITQRANINRGTFYLHFADKYILTDVVVRDAFRQELIGKLPPTPRWERHTIHMLIQAVLECLERKYHHQSRPLYALADVAPLVENAMHQELLEVLLTWLKQERRPQPHELERLERIARVVSWAIFGSALQWSQETTTVASQEMANTILLVIVEGVAHLLPEVTPK